jgi:hypothetical protein
MKDGNHGTRVEAARRRLLAWLTEWHLDRALGAEQERAAPGAGVAAQCCAGEPPPAVGQIRCLSPALRAGRRRPVHVACIAAGGAGKLVAAPYSRFAEPGLPGEFHTGRDTGPLRVLCAWNAREVAADVLSESWLADTLSERELEEAAAVRAALRGDAPLPPDLADRVGPPLTHPDDPRQEYRCEEADMMDDLAAGAPASASRPLEYPTRAELAPDALPKAAEPQDDYGSDTPPDAGRPQ